MEKIKHIIVIGASAGGYKAIGELIAKIPDNLPTAVFVVLHLAKNSLTETFRRELQIHTKLSCHVAVDDEPIKLKHLYLAPPDRHLLINENSIRVINGAKENLWRPSIDVLFRSAAANFGSRVIGIILTGLLNDGTAGMLAIKRSGGICIVQEPHEAEFDAMPYNVLTKVDVDYRVSISDMGYILDDIFSKPINTKFTPIPEDIKLESTINERAVSGIEDIEKLGKQTNYTCPDCGGALWKLDQDNFPRYRCHTGHVYTEKLLLEEQGKELEESLWVSIRILEQRKNLLLQLKDSDNSDVNTLRQQQADNINIHIERLKTLLVNIKAK
jgi:two-component system chemotaxis response regulator CheB